jgi:hypothetical protein
VKGGFGLARLAQKFVSLGAGWKSFGLRSKTFDFLIESFWESQDVFEATTLHDTTFLAYGS